MPERKRRRPTPEVPEWRCHRCQRLIILYERDRPDEGCLFAVTCAACEADLFDSLGIITGLDPTPPKST
jgi:hypothetical protein